MSIKIERIEKEMVREVSQILQMEVKNQFLKFITITDCHVTNDLSFAKIYFTCFQEEERKKFLREEDRRIHEKYKGKFKRVVEVRSTEEEE